jgi:hypothetical protein
LVIHFSVPPSNQNIKKQIPERDNTPNKIVPKVCKDTKLKKGKQLEFNSSLTQNLGSVIDINE